MSEKKSKTFEIQAVLQDNLVVVKDKNTGEDLSLVHKEIQHNIAHALGQIFNNPKKLDKFQLHIDKRNFEMAYEEIMKVMFFVRRTDDSTIYVKLKQLEYLNLSIEKRKNYLLLMLYLADKFKFFDDADKLSSELITYIDKENEIDIYSNTCLAKGNAHAQQGYLASATNIYNTILGLECSSGVKAWVYQGLSIISLSDKDKIEYCQKANEHFLETGEQLHVVKGLVAIATIEFQRGSVSKAFDLLEDAHMLIKDESDVNEAISAEILMIEARLYSLRKDNNKALELVNKAIGIMKGQYGNIEQQYGAVNLGIMLNRTLGNTDAIEELVEYKNEIDSMAGLVDKDFYEYKKIISIIDNNIGDYDELEELCNSVKSDMYKCILNITLAIKNINDDSLLKLDKAQAIIKEKKFDDIYDLLYISYGEVYKNKQEFEKAYHAYIESIKYNKNSTTAYNSCIKMLLDNNLWNLLATFLEITIKQFGEQPDICFIAGKTHYMLENYESAINYLSKAYASEEVNELILKSVNASDKDISLIASPIKKKSIDLNSLKSAIEDFAKTTASQTRMSFWHNTGSSYKWESKPEAKAKDLLIQFINGRFGEDSILITQEHIAGAGQIDIFVVLNSGLRIVIELKMCGYGYSSTYALSGDKQICHYMDFTEAKTKLGILVVFDARKRDFGKHIDAITTIENKTIYRFAVDVRPEYKS